METLKPMSHVNACARQHLLSSNALVYRLSGETAHQASGTLEAERTSQPGTLIFLTDVHGTTMTTCACLARKQVYEIAYHRSNHSEGSPHHLLTYFLFLRQANGSGTAKHHWSGMTEHPSSEQRSIAQHASQKCGEHWFNLQLPFPI